MSNATLERASCRPAVLPYYAEKDSLPDDLLPLIYRRLVAEDILPDLLHEKHMSEEEFVQFVSTDALLSLFLDQESGRYAGIAWLAQIEQADCVSKAWAAVAVFKEFATPPITQAFGQIALSQFFNILEFDVICCMVPKTNRLSQRYCRALGFDHKATLPGYTCHRGERTDAEIFMLERTQFNMEVVRG